MLCMCHFCRSRLLELWIGKNKNFLPIHILIESLYKHTQRSDLSTTYTFMLCYILSGRDTVSYAYRRGKRHAAHCGLKMVGCFPHMSVFGNKSHGILITQAIIEKHVNVFVSLYGREEFKSLDVLHACLWSFSKCDLTEDVFSLLCTSCLYIREHI